MPTTEHDAPPSPPSPPSPPVPPRRRLTRSRRQRVVAGVAGGLGEYFDLDPVIFRIAFVVLAVIGGAGILLYPAAWLLLPEEGQSMSIGERWIRCGRHGKWLPITLIVIGGLVLAGNLNNDHGGIGFAVAAVVVGVLLLRRHPRRHRHDPPAPTAGPVPPFPAAPPTPGGSPPPPEAGDPGPAEATESGSWSPPPPMPPTHDDTWTIPPAARRDRSGVSLTSIVLSVLLIGGGAVGLLNAADVVSVSVPVFLAVALVITGVALLVSAWLGGTGGLIAVAILLTAALAVASVVRAPLGGEWGERRWVPTSPEEVRSRYRVGAGDATLDLSHLALPTGALDVKASVGAGHLRVVVPGLGRIVADAHAGIGEVRLFERHQDGWDVTDRVSTGDPADGSLRLHLDVGAGQVEVVRALGIVRVGPRPPEPVSPPEPMSPPAPTTPPEPSTPPAPPVPPVGSALSSLEVPRAAA
ncbi:MAG: PspC domain protein [Acidimicrobiales bacterium]|nr:PspC domain protein [Acidimicrobiales bacterium]